MSIKHLTTYTYSLDGLRCTVQHSITRRAAHRDATHDRHQAIVERAQPSRPGTWTLRDSGGAGGSVDNRGMEPTYYAIWDRKA
ncbi:MAG: hypothetical protein M3Q42_05290 [Pseudomonadota bacterium]|nr:hypothetical protein [Pseudomonadota bacterium]